MKTESVKLCGEIGMYALDKLPHIDYTMIIYPGFNKKGESIYLFSLRCRPGFDVSTIAKQYGGGGHMQASGFECKNLHEVFRPSFYDYVYPSIIIMSTIIIITSYYMYNN